MTIHLMMARPLVISNARIDLVFYQFLLLVQVHHSPLVVDALPICEHDNAPKVNMLTCTSWELFLSLKASHNGVLSYNLNALVKCHHGR
jgi:hypothetical protein